MRLLFSKWLVLALTPLVVSFKANSQGTSDAKMGIDACYNQSWFNMKGSNMYEAAFVNARRGTFQVGVTYGRFGGGIKFMGWNTSIYDRQYVGNIDEASYRFAPFYVSYEQPLLKKKLSILSMAYIGVTKLETQGEQVGKGYGGHIGVRYYFLKGIFVNGDLGMQWDQYDVKANQELQDFYNKQRLIIMSVGLGFSL